MSSVCKALLQTSFGSSLYVFANSSLALVPVLSISSCTSRWHSHFHLCTSCFRCFSPHRSNNIPVIRSLQSAYSCRVFLTILHTAVSLDCCTVLIDISFNLLFKTGCFSITFRCYLVLNYSHQSKTQWLQATGHIISSLMCSEVREQETPEHSFVRSFWDWDTLEGFYFHAGELSDMKLKKVCFH